MADKQKDQDEQEELTPEQRIAKLEGSRKLSTILIIVLAVISLLQTGGLITMFVTSGDSRPAVNAEAIAAMEAKIQDMYDASKTVDAFNLKAQVMEDKLDRVLEETDLNNFAVLRDILKQQEESYAAFIKTLQQGMYDLSRMVRGSRTWYDVYKEDLDTILRDSLHRDQTLEKLEPMMPAKP